MKIILAICALTICAAILLIMINLSIMTLNDLDDRRRAKMRERLQAEGRLNEL